jgi:hypothetical protein
MQMMSSAIIANLNRNRYTLKGNKSWECMRKTTLICGSSAKDARDPYMKISCARAETAPSFTEE